MKNKICSYKTDEFRCQREVFQDLDYCIFHINFPKNKESKEYYEIYTEKKEKFEKSKEIDFTGAILPNINLNKFNADTSLNFKNTEIHGDVDFRGANIGRNINNNPINVNFTNAMINGNINLNRFNADISLNFKNTEIHGDVDFRLATIGNANENSINVNFTETVIYGNTNFRGTTVNGDVNFDQANIHGIANFRDATIRQLYFRKASIDKETIFINTTFSQKAHFKNTKFKGELNFEESKLKKAYFSGAKFFEDAKFNNAKFSDDIEFTKAIFKGNVYFTQKNASKKMFNKSVKFEETSFLSTGVFEYLKDFKASFKSARLKNVAFRECNLSQVMFEKVIFENCELSTSELPHKIVEHLKYENKIKKALKNSNKSENYIQIFHFLKLPLLVKIKDAETVADTYRRIRQCLQNQGAYDKAGKFYIKEMDMKKEIYWEKRKELWLLYSILSFTTGYGEKLKKILSIFLFYWIIYITIAYLMPGNNLVITIGSGILSILTALFVYVFARKMSR